MMKMIIMKEKDLKKYIIIIIVKIKKNQIMFLIYLPLLLAYVKIVLNIIASFANKRKLVDQY